MSESAAVPLPGGFGALEPEPEPEFLTVEDVPAPGVRSFASSASESSDDGDGGGGGGGGGSGEARFPGTRHAGGVSGSARPLTLAELAAHSSAGRAASVSPGAHFRCVKKAAVRAGFELETERLGFLEPGEEIEVLEARDNDRRQMRVRYEGGWTSIESAAGSVLLVNMRPDPADPPPLSQWAAAGLASGYEPLDRDLEEELEVESENPAFSAHLQEMELASRLLAEGDYKAASQCFGAMLFRDPNNDSAARGLRQAEKGVQFLLQEELQEWLEQQGLPDYGPSFFEQGFDDLSVLHSLRPKELGRLCRNVGMSTAHNRKLCAAVLVVQRAAEITADTPTAPHEQPQAAPKDLKSVQIADWLATIHMGGVLESPLVELGVSVVGDLLLLEEEDITALKVPLKKVQAIKFQTALSEALSKLRKAEATEAAEQGEDYDRYWQ